MAKKIIRDVVMGDRVGQVRSEMLDNDKTKPQFLSRKRSDSGPGFSAVTKSKKKWIWYGLAGLVVIVLFVGGTKIFASALVKVNPVTKSVPIDGTFTIYRDGEGEVTPSFKVIEILGEETGTATASGTKNVERKASGRIIVFNEFSQAPVKFIKNTRFEAPNGKIYKVLNPVTIPGTRVVSGKTVPGSVEIEVFAENPGAEYNIGLVDFKIPGLKNTPQYTKIYAKSKTPMTGGFSGKVFEVTEDDRDLVTQELESKLEKTLTDKLAGEIPPGFILLSDATKIKMDPVDEELPDTTGSADATTGGNIVNFNQAGKIYGIILDISEFSDSVADRYLEEGGYTKGEILINNPSDLIFDVLDSTTFDPSTSTSLSVDISGTAILVWQFDAQKLKNDLMGTAKSNYEKVLSAYPGIKSAEISMTPPWIRSFPSDPEKIKVEVALDLFD